MYALIQRTNKIAIYLEDLSDDLSYKEIQIPLMLRKMTKYFDGSISLQTLVQEIHIIHRANERYPTKDINNLDDVIFELNKYIKKIDWLYDLGILEISAFLKRLIQYFEGVLPYNQVVLPEYIGG